VNEVTDALIASLEKADPDVLLPHLAPDAVVWHNHDRVEVDARENFAAVTMLHQMASGIQVDVVRRAPLPDGFVLQFVLRGTVNTNKKPLEMHNCIVATCDDGKISRIDEYVDPNAGAQFS
jgi:ketosteroid isomerase-like protein